MMQVLLDVEIIGLKHQFLSAGLTGVAEKIRSKYGK